MDCPKCGGSRVKRAGQQRGNQRYECRDCGRKWQDSPAIPDIPDVLQQIGKRYNADELKALAKGGGINPHTIDRPNVNFDGEEVCIGFITDTHIGEESFSDHLWYSFLEEAQKEKIQFIAHSGDIIEGMSNRPDQVYHLTDIGFSAQMDHAAKLFNDSPFDIYAISGNHDRWGVKSGGLFVVPDLAKRVPKLHYIGSDCGTITLNDTQWMLWHGEDGSSYATSYRIQKLVEAFTGGDKPHVLLCGHTHKEIGMFERNVHCVSGGALSYQSAWMKSTRKGCATGFHIIRARIADGEIKRFTKTWYPYYR